MLQVAVLNFHVSRLVVPRVFLGLMAGHGCLPEQLGDRVIPPFGLGFSLLRFLPSLFFLPGVANVLPNVILLSIISAPSVHCEGQNHVPPPPPLAFHLFFW